MNPLMRLGASIILVVFPTTPIVYTTKGQHGSTRSTVEVSDKTEPPHTSAVLVIPKPTPVPTTQSPSQPIQPAKTAQNTPQPIVNTRTGISTSKEEIKAVIVKWADYYNVSSEQMLRVANCESGYQQYVVNKYETPGNSPSGIFQFKPQTFYSNARVLGVPNPDIWSIENQAQVAAWMFSIGQSVQWSCK